MEPSPPKKVLHGLFQSLSMPGDATAGDKDLGQTRCPQPVQTWAWCRGEALEESQLPKESELFMHADQLHLFHCLGL